MSENELKVRSLRMDEETFEKFKVIAGEEFGNQGQCLSALVNLYETEKSKLILVDRKLEIESFQMYVNKLNELFVTSLSLNQDTEERVRTTFEKSLTSKDGIIQDLQARLKESLGFQVELKDQNKIFSDEMKILKDSIEELEKNNDSIIKEHQETITNKNQMIEVLQGSIEDRKKEISSLEEHISSLSKEIKTAIENEEKNKELKILVTELETEKEKLLNKIQLQKQQHEFEIEKTILVEEKKSMEKLQALNDKLSTEILSHSAKNEALRDKHDASTSSLKEEIEKLKIELTQQLQENIQLKAEVTKPKSSVKK